jgi:hypothetical protein
VIPPGASTRGGQLRDPREAIAQLRQQLAMRWPGRVYQGDSRGLSVLSISPELTVWCNGREFIWREKGRPVSHPAADPVTAAVRLMARLQQLQRPPRGEGDDPPGPSTGTDAPGV